VSDGQQPSALGGTLFPQYFFCGALAFAAVGGNAEIFAQIAHGACPELGALANLAFGHGVANADVHGLDNMVELNRNDYHQIGQFPQEFYRNLADHVSRLLDN
jgi:hypothetical protein